jgi:hypothetical protein
MRGYRQMPCRARLSPDFHSEKLIECRENAACRTAGIREILVGRGFWGDGGGGGCTGSGHLAVDGLHSVETTAVTAVVF